MKKLGLISLLLIAASCTKAKAPMSILTSDCQDTIKFSTQILPLISDNCFSCHGDGMGQAPTFSDYNSIMTNADNILRTLRGDGAPLMPQGADPLPDSLIQKFSCWITQGKQNN